MPRPGRHRRPRLGPPSDRGPSVLPTVDPAPDRDGDGDRLGAARRGRRAATQSAGRARWRASTCATRPRRSGRVRCVARATCCWSPRPCPTGPLRRDPQALGDPDRRPRARTRRTRTSGGSLMVIGFVLIPFGIRRELRLEDPEKYARRARRRPGSGTRRTSRPDAGVRRAGPGRRARRPAGRGRRRSRGRRARPRRRWRARRGG